MEIPFLSRTEMFRVMARSLDLACPIFCTRGYESSGWGTL